MVWRIAVFNHADNVLKLFEQVLSKHGFEVVTYKQEDVSVAQIEQIRPDVIILGYLKGYSENEVKMIQELKTLPSTEKIPIIVCSTGEVYIDYDPLTGSIPYIQLLPKPFRAEELLAAVQAALQTGSDQAMSS